MIHARTLGLSEMKILTTRQADQAVYATNMSFPSSCSFFYHTAKGRKGEIESSIGSKGAV